MCCTTFAINEEYVIPEYINVSQEASNAVFVNLLSKFSVLAGDLKTLRSMGTIQGVIQNGVPDSNENISNKLISKFM